MASKIPKTKYHNEIIDTHETSAFHENQDPFLDQNYEKYIDENTKGNSDNEFFKLDLERTKMKADNVHGSKKVTSKDKNIREKTKFRKTFNPKMMSQLKHKKSMNHKDTGKCTELYQYYMDNIDFMILN